MGRIVFATGNAGKIREIKEILVGLSMEVVSMKDAGIQVDAEENGTTYEENALIKARAVAACLHGDDIVMADDSGLEVDYLNKEPGIYSARYAEGTDSDRCDKLLKNMANAKDRKARFISAVTMVFPDGKIVQAEGTCEGEIAFSPTGENGFGYDPVFYIAEFNKTIAQMSPDEKNSISHRGKALRLLSEKLKKL